MKRTLALIGAVLCLGGPGVSGQVGDSQRDIHAIDFRNFSYSPTCVEQGMRVTVTNGVFERPDEDDRMYFEVRNVIYGDLNRDGVDEAVVESVCNTGGTGQFSDGTVFMLRGGKAVAVATLGVGDRADGGIHDLRIEDGLLVVERYGQESSGACCPEYIESERLRMNGTRFVSASKPVRRIFLSMSRQEGEGPVRVRFLKGTSSATLSGSTNARERYLLGVRAEQKLDITFASKDARAVAKIMSASGTRMMTLRGGERWSGSIPESGDLTIAIESPTGADSSDAYFDIDLTVR